MTYEQWRQQAAKRGDLNTESAWNAAIAARDEELREQEPVGYVYTLGMNRVEHTAIKTRKVLPNGAALYAAPIPPMPSQQEALNDLRELDTNFEFEGRMAVLRNHLHHFILARPDAVQWQPIETCPKDGSSFLAWKAGRFNCVDHVVWYAGTVLQPSNEQRDAITHWMPLPTRPDEVTK